MQQKMSIYYALILHSSLKFKNCSHLKPLIKSETICRLGVSGILPQDQFVENLNNSLPTSNQHDSQLISIEDFLEIQIG